MKNVKIDDSNQDKLIQKTIEERKKKELEKLKKKKTRK